MSITLCPNPGCRREVPYGGARCTACGAVVVRRAAPTPPPVVERRGTTVNIGYRMGRLALLLVIVLAGSIGVAAMKRARWEVREVDGMRFEAPVKMRAMSDIPLQVRDDTFATTHYQGKKRKMVVEVLHIVADPRTIRSAMDTASRMMTADLKRLPNVRVTGSEIRTVRFPGANARRTVIRYLRGGRANRNDGLLLRQGDEFWMIEVGAPETPENEAQARRILDSVRLPPRRR